MTEKLDKKNIAQISISEYNDSEDQEQRTIYALDNEGEIWMSYFLRPYNKPCYWTDFGKLEFGPPKED